jgi:hypothetical protein
VSSVGPTCVVCVSAKVHIVIRDCVNCAVCHYECMVWALTHIYNMIYLLTYSMEQSPSWEANSNMIYSCCICLYVCIYMCLFRINDNFCILGWCNYDGSVEYYYYYYYYYYLHKAYIYFDCLRIVRTVQ